jgi:hypothetical protein
MKNDMLNLGKGGNTKEYWLDGECVCESGSKGFQRFFLLFEEA